MGTTNGIELHINGKVQGVGFRPYVWQLAHQLQLLGDVSNNGNGVIIHLWLDTPTPQTHNHTELLDTFIKQLHDHCPPLARIHSVITRPYHWATPPHDFTIIHSGEGQMDTHIVPDAATCDACLNELHNPQNRRYHYPFTNCTHCGPRFTIIERIPYDRANTSMKKFALCPECQAEYDNPANRRFHAQPNACPVCGPHVWLSNAAGETIAQHDEAIRLAAQALIQGQIIAVKGLGGFHLACDATQQTAVERLRQRKNRPNKPLAVMLPNQNWLKPCIQLPPSADQDGAYTRLTSLLRSPAAPIVLLPKKADTPLCPAIAPGMTEVGLMLPANPLQHLLLCETDRPLVMTSGNARGKPPALANAQALETLAPIADLWLMHNRDIVQRADDSVVRFNFAPPSPPPATTKEQQPLPPSAEVLRRARGYVPDAIELPQGFTQCPPILALGGDLKNTFCLLRNESAVLSQHFGDLADLDIQGQVKHAITVFQNIYQFTPQAIALDAHPGYISHALGHELAKQLNIPAIKTFHHHAHIASCMAEHNYPHASPPVIGLALDGLGYGADGTLWGGECLIANYTHCQHIGGLPAVALPGGNLASRQPWRNLLAHLLKFVPQWQQYPEATHIPQEQIPVLQRAIARGLNAPAASSAGRLFDAVAAALGIAPDQLTWEGEAACRLEALAASCAPFTPPVTIPVKNNMLDLATFWQQWLNWQAPGPERAYAFHYALAQGFAKLAHATAQQHNLTTIALSGGVMHNVLLRKLLCEFLHNYAILIPARLPAGDGGLSLGQALIALAQHPKP